jgi:hypothetical protein
MTKDHPDFDRTFIYLNNRWCRGVLAADDEEGWVEILDITAMSPAPPIDKEIQNVDSSLPTAWEHLRTKRKYGKVEFRQL